MPQIHVRQLMGNHPSHERNRFLLDRSLDDNGPARFAPAAESHGHLHHRMRPRIEIVYHKFRIIHQIDPDLVRQIFDDGCDMIPDPSVQRKCPEPLIDCRRCHPSILAAREG